MPSKPCLWVSGPPAPNPVTVVRMMSGLTWRRLSRSSASERNTARRQIGDDDIGGRDQLPDDLAALGRGRVEGHAELVAVHRQEHRAAALGAGADRDEAAVLAAAEPLDADHLGAEIAEQRRAERPGDVAAEIENANAVEHTGHADPSPLAPATGNTAAYRRRAARRHRFPHLWRAGRAGTLRPARSIHDRKGAIMARLPPITSKDQVAEKDHAIFDSIVASRGAVQGPFTMFLHSPGFGRPPRASGRLCAL